VRSRRWIALAASGLIALGVAACGEDEDGGKGVSGAISLDGSSTVYPFAQAAAERFRQDNPDAKITVGESGTGGGFKKFCAGEIDIANASREIKSDEEAPVCKRNGISYVELQVANDGIAVTTNKGLTIGCLTVDQLKKLWGKGSTVRNYSELGSGLPNQRASLFGPGTDSGTFDFFTKEINGEEGDSRSDYQASEDDNILVQGVSGDRGALGYFGFSYYEQNRDRLNLVKVNGGSGCVEPTTQTIQSGTYKPLSRPLFMYVSNKGLAKSQVKAFLEFALQNHSSIAQAAKFVSMTPEQAQKAQQALTQAGGGQAQTQTPPQ
jgi:phosphate transport system substrate-binding protein